jgi:hypothetical protein
LSGNSCELSKADRIIAAAGGDFDRPYSGNFIPEEGRIAKARPVDIDRLSRARGKIIANTVQ